MKRLFFLTLVGLVTSLPSTIHSEQCDCITYDWLATVAKNTPYTDHIFHFRHLFNTMKVRGFLELGCGFSTKYFIDNAKQVTSIEFMSPTSGAFLFNEAKRLFKECKNWTGLAYNQDLKDDKFNLACSYHYVTHKDYSLVDASYLDALSSFMKAQLRTIRQEGSEIDVAFVDPAISLRGDLVNILLDNKIPVVVAHDTSNDQETMSDECLYGWNKVKVPQDYEKIYVSLGEGTTFWISKSLPNLIESMQKYRDLLLDQAQQKCLKVEDLTSLADQK